MFYVSKNHFLLFSPFYREVGEYRKVVYNYKQWVSEIERMSGVENAFTSVYPLNGLIDKIFFDIDSPNIERAFTIAKKLYSWLLDNGYTAIPVASGKKGFHIYVLLEGSVYNGKAESEKKELLLNALYYILDKSGLFVNGRVVPEIDERVLGDLKRLTRVPNTKRPDNGAYTVFLPANFDELDIIDVIAFTRRAPKHDFDYEIRELPSLYDFPKQKYVPLFLTETKTALTKEIITRTPESVREYLKRLLRPCIYNTIIDIEPRHHIRVAATIDLQQLGFSAEEVVSVYSKLGWRDFDIEKTTTYVNHIFSKNYKPYSCSKLRSIVGTKYCANCMFRQGFR